MTRRRALFVAADLPWPPDAGGRIATLNILEAFSSVFTVDLVALADPAAPPELGHLREICEQVVIVRHPFTFGRHPARQIGVAAASTLSSTPYRLRKFASRRLGDAIATLGETHSYAIAHFDQFGVAPYRPDKWPTTIAHHNVESDVYRLGAAEARDPLRRYWLDRERRKLAQVEATLLPAFDHVYALAAEDAELIRELGVDRVSVLPMPAPATVPDRPPPATPSILSLGSMSWFGVGAGLAWFGEYVLPLVRARVPEARWVIAGAHAPRRIRSLATKPGIELAGHVDDLSGLVAGTRVAIVPLMVAGGIRMKLLDFMAWRVPAVATTLAARGLGFADGHGAMRRNSPEDFASAVVDMLTDDARWSEVERRGAAFIAQHHGKAQLLEGVVMGTESAMERHRRVAGGRGV